MSRRGAPSAGTGAASASDRASAAAVRSALSPVADDSFTATSPDPTRSPLENQSHLSRILAAAASTSSNHARSAPQPQSQSQSQSQSRSQSQSQSYPVPALQSQQYQPMPSAIRNNTPVAAVATGAPAMAGNGTAPVASPGASSGQQQLWASLNLDPLLIAHASGLHRILQDIQSLKSQFELFASHVVHMSKGGAALTAHLQSLFAEGTVPPPIQLLQSSHQSMHTSSLSWFSSRLRNEILNAFDDWIDDAEEVLTQLGLVQKTRHELDGLQDEVEKLFSRKLESPHWDAHAESSLQRRLENSKEKLAQACMLYDGQRRGVEKSLHFLLAQRAQLLHQVTCCFAECEYRFFRDFSAHAAGFVAAYPYSATPPVCQFAGDAVFAQSHLSGTSTSASALLLTLPPFQWTDPAHVDESLEGPSVRAIRRSMSQKKQRDSRESSRRNSVDASGAAHAPVKEAPASDDAPSAWEAQASRWAATQLQARESEEAQQAGRSALPQSSAAMSTSPSSALSPRLHTFNGEIEAEPVHAQPVREEEEEAVEDLNMAELQQVEEEEEEEAEAEPQAAAPDQTAVAEEEEEEEEEDEDAAAARAAKRERKRLKKLKKEAKRAKKAARRARLAAGEEYTDSEAEEEEEEVADADDESLSASPSPPPARASAAAAAAASMQSPSPVAMQTSIDPLSPNSGSGFRVSIQPQPSKGGPAQSAPAARVLSPALASQSPPTSRVPRALSASSNRSDATSDNDLDEFVSPEPLVSTSPSPQRLQEEAQMHQQMEAMHMQQQQPQQPQSAADSLMPIRYPDLGRAAEQQAYAAAALNLPAKMLPMPPPSVPLHPALWTAVPLTAIKGSIWGRNLVDHILFDDETDEMHEKYALLPQHLPLFEGAFRAEYPLESYVAAAQAEREHKRNQLIAAAQQTQTSKAHQVALAAAPGSRRAVSAQPSDRFAGMRRIDGGSYSAPVASLDLPSFPAPPFPTCTAKQVYLAHEILARVLYPYTPAEVVHALYRLDDKVLTPDRVAGLAKIMPTADQRDAILHAASERQIRLPAGVNLTPLEQLFSWLSCAATPSLSSRLACMSFQSEFGPLCYHLEATLAILEKCVAEVRKSENLRVIFAILLNLGNYQNVSHGVLPAYGFSLDFLPELRRIRMSGGHHSTLLDFLVFYLSTSYPSLSLSSFSPSAFPHLAQALRVDEVLFAMECRYLDEQFALLRTVNDQDDYERQNRSVTATSATVNTGATNGHAGSGAPGSSGVITLPFPVSSFPPRVPRFLSYVQARMTVLRHKHAKVRADLAELMRYLCVEPEGVRDPSLDAALAAAAAAAAAARRSPPSPTSAAGGEAAAMRDLPVTLPPLGEIITPQMAAAATNPNTQAGSVLHSRLPWQRSLRTLQTFLAEFSLALQDYTVAAKVNRTQNA